METPPRYVVLAIDVGSSSVRCTAYEVTSVGDYDPFHVCAASSIPRKVVQPSTGRILVYDDEDEDHKLFDDIDQCVDEVLDQLKPSSGKVVAVGFSTLVMNLIGVDEGFVPCGNDTTLSYACQTPTVNKEVEYLKRELDPETLQNLYQRTGAPIHAAYALPQLRAWYQSSNNTERVHRWQSIASVCIARWTGRTDVPISYSEASWTGLLNFRTCRYEPAILQLLPPSCIAALPRLADYSGQSMNEENIDTSVSTSFYLSSSLPCPEDAVGTTNPYWLRWPMLQGARLFLGVGDGACANLGSGCGMDTGRIACTIGTSAAARVCVPCPIATDWNAAFNEASFLRRVPSGLFCYRIDASRVLIGGALTDGGSALEWITNLLRIPMASDDFQVCLDTGTERLREFYHQHDMQEQKGSPNAAPLILPFWSGERSTGYRTGATGAILGLTLNTRAEDLILSTLEGVTLRLNAIIRLILQVMNDSTSPPIILCSGKALERNVLWRSMLADCTGLPVVMEEETYEATSRGVAMLLREVLIEEGLPLSKCSKDSTSILVDRSSQTTHAPNESARGYWDTRFQTQEAVLEAIAPVLYHTNKSTC